MTCSQIQVQTLFWECLIVDACQLEKHLCLILEELRGYLISRNVQEIIFYYLDLALFAQPVK